MRSVHRQCKPSMCSSVSARVCVVIFSFEYMNAYRQYARKKLILFISAHNGWIFACKFHWFYCSKHQYSTINITSSLKYSFPFALAFVLLRSMKRIRIAKANATSNYSYFLYLFQWMCDSESVHLYEIHRHWMQLPVWAAAYTILSQSVQFSCAIANIRLNFLWSIHSIGLIFHASRVCRLHQPNYEWIDYAIIVLNDSFWLYCRRQCIFYLRPGILCQIRSQNRIWNRWDPNQDRRIWYLRCWLVECFVENLLILIFRSDHLMRWDYR